MLVRELPIGKQETEKDIEVNEAFVWFAVLVAETDDPWAVGVVAGVGVSVGTGIGVGEKDRVRLSRVYRHTADVDIALDVGQDIFGFHAVEFFNQGGEDVSQDDLMPQQELRVLVVL